MRLIRGLHSLALFKRPCVATIGVFDGLHRGHHAVIEQVKCKARELKVPSVVILFEPQPFEFFHPDTAAPRLTRLRDKLMILKNWQVDYVLCLRFDATLAQLSPQDFIQKILIDGLHVKHLVVGDDFRFGKGRMGDFELLCQQKHFTVQDTKTLLQAGQRISSTQVRTAIAAGDFAKAEQLLGRSYVLHGKVQHGDKRGRQLGFPTLNIGSLKPMVVHGVYAVKVYGIGNQVLNGVANVGRRPTVDGIKRLLEVYLLDFTGDCYGRSICVEFVAKIRDEQKFTSLELLKQQIQQDVAEVKLFFSSKSNI
jgi:riboflavin kinase/FMN adenylyltransferase